MIKFREHRRLLDESMETVREVGDRQELEMLLAEIFRPWIGARDEIDWSLLRVERYGYDDRINWDTHIVTLPKYGVLGMTNGPLS